MPFVSQLAIGTVCTLLCINCGSNRRLNPPPLTLNILMQCSLFSISHSFSVHSSELAVYMCEECFRSCCLRGQVSLSHMEINLSRRAFHSKVPSRFTIMSREGVDVSAPLTLLLLNGLLLREHTLKSFYQDKQKDQLTQDFKRNIRDYTQSKTYSLCRYENQLRDQKSNIIYT